MISLASEMTDSKGRHARGWLFFDAECKFCTGIAMWLVAPMHRRGLAVAPLQDPRVGALLGLSREELLSAIWFVSEDGTQYSGADAVLAVAHEFSWAHPLLWASRVPGMITVMRAGYRWVAQHRSCPAGYCAVKQVPSRNP
jgi:predicted DCC family thiol-disulfide oxidoreductase YuxK